MWMIQLQYANEEGKNQGGLYLNVDAIAAVRAEKGGPDRDLVYRGYWCKILMVNGIEYRIVNQISEVLDEIVKINCQRIDSNPSR